MRLQNYWKKFLATFRSEKKNEIALPQFKPVAVHSFITQSSLAYQIYTDGYALIDLPSQFSLKEISELFAHTHSFSAETSGVFFGVFSNNVKYKKYVHETLCNIAYKAFDNLFQNYQIQIANFAVKTSGHNTFVPFHQDNASVDEDLYSSINVWIPLQDVNTRNGAVWLVPKSHHLYYGHRCTSIPSLLENISDNLFPFALPIQVSKGQALLFDTRIFHFSNPNLSSDTRAAAVFRVSNKEAKVRAYYYDNSSKTPSIEAWNCPSDHLLITQAYNDKHRPKQGELEWKKELPIEPLQPDTFLQLAAKLKIPPVNKCTDGKGSTTFLSEPNE
ncbi:MAG: phytanoyl-CoA dioxygenase family protein [Chitinophagales bacterium]|nr:phytanoyl-CoA dioxygenase family protein [Chitinophagales bacterium]